MAPHNWYTQRIDETSKLLSHTKTQINRISLLRVLLFVAGIAGLILFYSSGTGAIVLTLCCTFLPFFILVKVHNRLYFRKERLEIQLKLNQDELKGLEGDWSAFDEGREFIDPEHPYSYATSSDANRSSKPSDVPAHTSENRPLPHGCSIT